MNEEQGQLVELIASHERWLMRRILGYALDHGYTRYTSTLEEAWRLSIAGLSEALISALKSNGTTLEFGPDDAFESDPLAAFGVYEARKHRQRGTSLAMFLGLFKYYRQSYLDLLSEGTFDPDQAVRLSRAIIRFFDRVEIAFCTEWSRVVDSGALVGELQSLNRQMTNEKNKYLTVFESLAIPIILLGPDQRIENMNHAAASLLQQTQTPGARYYQEHLLGDHLPWLADEIASFAAGAEREASFEKSLRMNGKRRHYQVQLSRMLDVSNKYLGTVITLNDITHRLRTEAALYESESRYRLLVENSESPIAILERSGLILFASGVMAAMWGETPDRIIGKTIWEIFPQEAADQQMEYVRQVMDTGKGAKIQITVPVHGQAHWFSINIAPVTDASGRIYGAQTVAHDITDLKLAEEALRQSEHKFRGMVEQSGDAIVIADAHGAIVEWNHSAERVFGIPASEALGQPIWDVQFRTALDEYRTPHNYERLKAVLQAQLRGENAGWLNQLLETSIQLPDGSRPTVQTLVFPIQSDQGVMLGSISRDVTERKRAEAIAARDARADALVAEVSRALLSQTTIEEISNLVLEQALQLTDSHFGLVFQIDPATHSAGTMSMTRNIWDACQVADKQPTFHEYRGLWGWVLDQKKPLLSNDPSADLRSTGVPEGHVPIKRFLAAPALIGDTLVGEIALANAERDYDERDLAALERLAYLYALAIQRRYDQEALKNSEERYRTLIENQGEGAGYVDADERFVFANPAAHDIFGVPQGQLLGRNLSEFLNAAQFDAVRAQTQIRRAGEKSSYELEITRPDGQRRLLLVTATPQFDSNGQFSGSFGIFRDITERKQAEDRLRRYAEELEERNEEIKNFAYIISHDLRAPLVNLKGFAAELRSAVQVIAENIDPALPHLSEVQRNTITRTLQEDVGESLGFIDFAVSRMDEFLKAVLRLSRLGRQELSFETVDVEIIAQEALASLAHQVAEHHASIHIQPMPPVVADRTSMEQIIGNLISNAVKYLDPARPGYIEIGGQRAQDETIFYVKDNGRGIAEEDLPKVFMPFRRLGKQDTVGEGIGLTYVQTLVRRHGGRIWCESTLGQGSLFTFTISHNLQ